MHIILGGTHGLGWDLAQQLRAQGSQVQVIGRSYDIAIHGEGLKADIANSNDVEEVSKFFEALSEGIEGFYWVVGVGYQGDFADQSNVRGMLNTNLVGPLLVTQAAWRKMAQQATQSHLVVVSSTTGIKIRTVETVYATTKGAQVSFARNLGEEAVRLESSVRVTLFEPGGMQSPFWDDEKRRSEAYGSFMKTADVAAFMLENLQAQTETFAEKMIEKPELDTWLKTKDAR